MKPKINFWQKANLFRKRHIWAILASILALATWWHEKVTIEENRSTLSDFFRMENQNNIALLGIRIFEVQLNQTISLQKNFRNDSSYNAAFFLGVHNKIVQENLVWFNFQVQLDLHPDLAAANLIKEEKARRDKELEDIIKTQNVDIIYNYDNKKTLAFSAEVRKAEKDTQIALNELNTTSKHQLYLYISLYLSAAFLFFVDRIRNVEVEEN